MNGWKHKHTHSENCQVMLLFSYRNSFPALFPVQDKHNTIYCHWQWGSVHVLLCAGWTVASGQTRDNFSLRPFPTTTAAIPGPLGQCASSPVGRGEAQVPARLHGGHILHRGNSQWRSDIWTLIVSSIILLLRIFAKQMYSCACLLKKDH